MTAFGDEYAEDFSLQRIFEVTTRSKIGSPSCISNSIQADWNMDSSDVTLA